MKVNNKTIFIIIVNKIYKLWVIEYYIVFKIVLRSHKSIRRLY